MSAVNEALEAVMDLINTTFPFAKITRGALPTGNGLTLEIGPSGDESVFMSKNTTIPLDVTINGKNKNLKTLSDHMNDIHFGLTRLRKYPSGRNWQITDILNQTLPQIVGRGESNEWLMASSLLVKVFLRGD